MKRVLLMSLTAALLLLPARAPAQQPGDPIESAREALRTSNDYPWYDEQADDLQRVDVETPQADAANRNSNWESQAKKTKQTTAKSGSGWFPWSLGGVLKVLAWTALAVLLGALIWLLVKAYLRSEEMSVTVRTSADLGDDAAGEIERIESLPFDVKRPRSNLLAEAQRHYENGDYGQAVIYLFSYQLVHLDKHELIRLSRGKTNRQYLRELRRSRRLFELLENTMVAFEDVFFGRYTLARERFENCWNGLDEFHRLVDGAAT